MGGRVTAPGKDVLRDSQPREVESAYGVALLLTLASIIVTIAAGTEFVAPVVAGVLQGLALVTVLLVSGVRRRTAIFALIAGIAATGIATLLIFSIDAAFPAVPILWGLIVTGTIVAVARRLREFERVNLQAVLGLLTVYLLLGLLFSYGFLLVGSMTGEFFSSGERRAASYVYFSYITLATVGYGDLTPVAGLPRALAVLEALVGQLYLVSVVALAIGRFGLARGENRRL